MIFFYILPYIVPNNCEFMMQENAIYEYADFLPPYEFS